MSEESLAVATSRHPWLRYAIAVASGLFVLFCAADSLLAAQFAGRILPGVKIGSTPVGGLNQKQAARVVAQQLNVYKIFLKIGPNHFEINTQSLGAKFDIEATVEQAYLLGRQHLFAFPGLSDAARQGGIGYSYALDRGSLNNFITTVMNTVKELPVDAQIKIVGGVPKVEPDKRGQAVNRAELLQLLEQAIAGGASAHLALEPTSVAADITVAKTPPAVEQAKALLLTEIDLSYQDKNFRPTPADIGNWLVFAKDANLNLTVKADPARIKDYVQNNLANVINIPPQNKKVTVENGVSKITQEGRDGLAVNQDALVAAIVTALEGPSRRLVYGIMTQPVAYKTETNRVISLEYGRYIELNLSTQHLWAYQDHQVVYESPVASGASAYGFGTVTGLFAIYYKTTETYLNGAPYGWNYNVPVHYWMPFYGGYGLHDARWRSTFGGADYIYNGSHGCVNLPDATAAWLYGWAPVGTPVWIHK
jgi:lipoprotein-anchoring transpeptidase ErfK/SrfK